MDIMNIIEEYVKVSVKWSRLNSLKHIEEQFENAALQGSRDSSFGSSQKMKKDFLEKAKVHASKISDLRIELSRVEKLLEHAHSLYSEAIDGMSLQQLEKLHNILQVKIEELINKQKEDDGTRIWANQQADLSFRNHEFSKQKRFNDIASDAYYESQDIIDSLVFYNQIVKVIESKIKEVKFFSSNNSYSGYGFNI